MTDEPARKRRRGRGQEEQARPAPTRAPALLSWMRNVSVIDQDDTPLVSSVEPALDSRLQASLTAAGVSKLFPVQTAVWTALHGGAFDGHDLCINAPTGSGKTLAYALPIVAALSVRVTCRLRALVVLPTHDLAQQVCG